MGSSAHTPVLPEGRDDRLIVVLEEKSVIGDCLIQLKGGGGEKKKDSIDFGSDMNNCIKHDSDTGG